MKLLAVETATEACSAALLIGEEITERYRLAPRKHAELILPMAEELLSDAGIGLTDLDAVAFGRGPGSFTGLRIAAGIVQGIAFGADLPVVPVSTLAVLAQGVMQEFDVPNVLAAIDARMGEVYWGAYSRNQNGLARLQGKEKVSAPEHVSSIDSGPWLGAGSGWTDYQAQLKKILGNKINRVILDRFPHAADVALLAVNAFEAGMVVSAEAATPEYLRNNVARKPVTPKAE